ncbi:MAG TPA: TlpA disulfide reductase family protein [Verrucomicrobiae bacterium]|nr:TlpA disulfide reductase family protein [Verrucomicrobiae bacterium]
MSSLKIYLFAAVLVAAPISRGAIKPSEIENQLKSLRSVASDQKSAVIVKLATDIRSLPAGTQKVGYADALSHLVTEGDPGHDALQAVADTLSAALIESPLPAKGDKIPIPYNQVAMLVRYEGVTSTLKDPLYDKAAKMLADNEADIEKADFTLKTLKNKKVTLSGLRGKIVLVNFWATWCPPCRAEMGDLDVLQRYFESQGLVVLSITDEDGFKVSQFIGGNKYAPDVVLDPGGKVHQAFHITGIPRTFLFGRDGKLLAVAIDQRSRRQFLEMLSKTDLHR